MGKFVILGKQECPYCKDAVELLYSHGIEHVYFDVNHRDGLKDYLIQCGLTTVPQIYYNGDRVGGFSELPRFLRLIGVIK